MQFAYIVSSANSEWVKDSILGFLVFLISILRAILHVLWLTTHKRGFYQFYSNEASSKSDKSIVLDGIDSEQKCYL